MDTIRERIARIWAGARFRVAAFFWDALDYFDRRGFSAPEFVLGAVAAFAVLGLLRLFGG